MITQDLIDYYVNLLIMQFNSLPKAQGTVEAYVKEAVADQIIQQTNDAFDLETAEGAQLDILGKYVGAPREILGLDFGKSYFATPLYGDADIPSYKGFAIYGESPVDYFLLYADLTGTKYRLTDYELRNFIKFKAEANKIDSSLKEIDLLLIKFFPDGCLLTDSLNMQLTYTFSATIDTLPQLVVFTKSLPKPTGVTINIIGV